MYEINIVGTGGRYCIFRIQDQRILGVELKAKCNKHPIIPKTIYELIGNPIEMLYNDDGTNHFELIKQFLTNPTTQEE